MLREFHIHNLAIIDELAMELSLGLNVLTGETGAGKSIILGALNLILGERASAEDIRTGCTEARVEAVFDCSARRPVNEFLEENNLPLNEGEVIVRREITRSGKGRCLVNGVLLPLYQLKALGELLVDLHGQHQHQSLLSRTAQLDVLDAFGDYSNVLEEYRTTYKAYREKQKAHSALSQSEQEVERRKGFLQFQIDEISKARLAENEDSELELERARLLNAEKLTLAATTLYDLLYEGEKQGTSVVQLLAQADAELTTLISTEPNMGHLADTLAEIKAKIEDVAAAARSYAGCIEKDPERLDEVESRLELIRKLKRKYGSTVADILSQLEAFKKELSQLEHRSDELTVLERELDELGSRVEQLAEELSQRRKESARTFERRLVAELKELNMPRTRFTVQFWRAERATDELPVHRSPYSFTANGADQMEFLISPNPGEDLRPLKKIASGGELSRIMLALKSLTAGKDRIPTLVFDEIDVGISGKAADRLGDKMAQLGRTHQIICITHLPHIAARATTHYAVSKTVEKARTVTFVQRLDYHTRLEELARLLDGKGESSISRKHAEEMLRANPTLKLSA
jgi:DNA repair protein RecN (Recombination protein N)